MSGKHIPLISEAFNKKRAISFRLLVSLIDVVSCKR